MDTYISVILGFLLATTAFAFMLLSHMFYYNHTLRYYYKRASAFYNMGYTDVHFNEEVIEYDPIQTPPRRSIFFGR